jgi:hypothetical protein
VYGVYAATISSVSNKNNNNTVDIALSYVAKLQGTDRGEYIRCSKTEKERLDIIEAKSPGLQVDYSVIGRICAGLREDIYKDISHDYRFIGELDSDGFPMVHGGGITAASISKITGGEELADHYKWLIDQYGVHPDSAFLYIYDEGLPPPGGYLPDALIGYGYDYPIRDVLFVLHACRNAPSVSIYLYRDEVPERMSLMGHCNGGRYIGSGEYGATLQPHVSLYRAEATGFNGSKQETPQSSPAGGSGQNNGDYKPSTGTDSLQSR